MLIDDDITRGTTRLITVCGVPLAVLCRFRPRPWWRFIDAWALAESSNRLWPIPPPYRQSAQARQLDGSIERLELRPDSDVTGWSSRLRTALESAMPGWALLGAGRMYRVINGVPASLNGVPASLLASGVGSYGWVMLRLDRGRVSLSPAACGVAYDAIGYPLMSPIVPLPIT